MKTIMSTTRLKTTVLSEISSTTTPEKRQSVFGTTTNVTGMMQSRIRRTINNGKHFEQENEINSFIDFVSGLTFIRKAQPKHV